MLPAQVFVTSAHTLLLGNTFGHCARFKPVSSPDCTFIAICSSAHSLYCSATSAHSCISSSLPAHLVVSYILWIVDTFFLLCLLLPIPSRCRSTLLPFFTLVISLSPFIPLVTKNRRLACLLSGGFIFISTSLKIQETLRPIPHSGSV